MEDFFNQNIESHITEKMRESNTGYLKCTGNNEKEIAIATMRLTVNFFCKIQSHCNTMMRNNVRIFGTTILFDIENTKIPKDKPNTVGRL